MEIRRFFDRIRLAVFNICLLFQYFHSYFLTIVYTDIKYKDIVNTVLFISEVSSFLYLFLSYIRKGYLDYKLEKEDLLNCNLTRRFCRICDGFKPERVHHCSSCKRCIKKMDHHCMWMGVCVNYYNHGDFIRCLISISLSNIIINFYSFYRLYLFCYKFIILEYYEIGLLIFSILLGFLLFIVCSYMVRIQMRLIMKNITYIEELKYEDIFYEKNLLFQSSYDKGYYNNFKEVFGSPYLLFLWKPSGNGISFVKNPGSTNSKFKNSIYYDYI